MAKASVVVIERTGRPRKWAKLWPVYQTLRSRGMSCVRAVEWLITEGAVAEEEKERAINAFHIHATRRNKKQKAASTEVLPSKS